MLLLVILIKTMCGGILKVLKELEVRKVIIGKQGEESSQYQEFCRIVEEKKIQVVVVKQGDVINIEQNIEKEDVEDNKIKELYTIENNNIISNKSGMEEP